MVKVMLATGGSAGHIFPALAVAKEFKSAGHEVFFAGVFADFKNHILSQGHSIRELSAQGLNTKTLKGAFISSFYMLKSIKESDILLKNVKPDVVLGFGGYGAFPVVLAALMSGYPTMIHEQNVLPGRANRLLARWVAKVAVSFETSCRYFPAAKTVFTGYPCYRVKAKEPDRARLKTGLGLKADHYTIFVLGGSQGSHKINLIFMHTIAMLKKELPLQVIHISGMKDYSHLAGEYPHPGADHQ